MGKLSKVDLRYQDKQMRTNDSNYQGKS